MDRPAKPPHDKVRPFAPEDYPKGDNRPLETAYRRYYLQYMHWARSRWSLEDHDLAEAFNEAVMIFRNKAWEGQLEGYRGKGVNTILFAFAANLVRNRLKKEGKYQSRMLPLTNEGQAEEGIGQLEADSSDLVDEAQDDPIFHKAPEGRMAQLKQGMAQLTERCRQILVARIVHGHSMPEIAEQLGMANADTAKTAKNKCLNRLKKLMGRLPKGS